MAAQVRSDEGLSIAWRNSGDRKAIAELFRRCVGHAYRVVLRASARPQDAEDAVGEALATAMRGPCRAAVYGTIYCAGGATRRFARRSRVYDR